MSLMDKIKADREALAKKSPIPAVEVQKAEVDALNAELDSEIDDSIDKSKEENLTPEQEAKRSNDSYEDEIKKLREENAKRRKKEQEAKERALAMADEVFKTEREEYESKIAEMSKQLSESKALKKEESKVEKEIQNAESRAESDELRRELKELQAANKIIQAQIQSQKEAEESEKALRRQAAENRFKSMVAEIPEEFKEAASAMFKGYTDPSEGLIALTKYKAQGLFGKKTIEVVNRIPKEDNNNNTSELNSRQKRDKRTNALKERRQGLQAGGRIL